MREHGARRWPSGSERRRPARAAAASGRRRCGRRSSRGCCGGCGGRCRGAWWTRGRRRVQCEGLVSKLHPSREVRRTSPSSLLNRFIVASRCAALRCLAAGARAQALSGVHSCVNGLSSHVSHTTNLACTGAGAVGRAGALLAGLLRLVPPTRRATPTSVGRPLLAGLLRLVRPTPPLRGARGQRGGNARPRGAHARGEGGGG